MYAKLFASLYQGTLRGRSDEILVFTNLLAHTSAGGIVDKHFRAIADETGLSVDRVKSAIETLESPDPESRSPEHGGARIVRMDDHRAWGWIVVNYEKYRSIKSEADRAEQNRLAQQRWRDRQKAQKEADRNAGVSNDKQDKPKEKQKEKDLSPLPLSQTPPVEPPLTDEEREGMEFDDEPPPTLWKIDLTANGTPALIEKLATKYPMNGAYKLTREAIIDLVKEGEDLNEVLKKTEVIVARIRALPPHRRQRLPGKVSFFAERRYNDDPNAFPWVHVDEPVKTEKPKSKYL